MASSTFWEPDSTPIQTSRAPARASAWAMRPVIRLTRDCMVKGVRQPARSTASAKPAAHWESRANMSSVNQMWSGATSAFSNSSSCATPSGEREVYRRPKVGFAHQLQA